MLNFNTSVVLACLFFGLNAAASPTPNIAEVIPGPGLPSLESLGLTSADLYQRYPARSIARDAENTSLSKRVDTTCQTADTVSAANAEACVNFLRNLGTTPCTVSGENVVFCTAGDAQVGGSNITGHSVSSFCSDVAIGVQNILNQCTLSNGQVEVFAAANGNGDIIVSIEAIGN